MNKICVVFFSFIFAFFISISMALLTSPSSVIAGTKQEDFHSLSLIEFDDTIIQIEMNGYFSSLLTESGRVFTWGDNQYGQLGNGNTINQYAPVEITSSFPLGDKVVKLSASEASFAALTESGRVFTWGWNLFGTLGNGTNTNSSIPIEITQYFPNDDTVVDIIMGGYYGFAKTTSGRIFSWGYNNYGQLGKEYPQAQNLPIEITNQFPVGDPILKLDAGGAHAGAISENGKFYMWGSNANGEVANIGVKVTPFDVTELFFENETIESLSFKGNTSYALMTSDKVFAWGNKYTTVGDGTFKDEDLFVPTDITAFFPIGDKIVDITTGFTNSAAITESGKVLFWGWNSSGEVGNNTKDQQHIPYDLSSFFPEGDKIIQISLGYNHSAALSESGLVYLWGSNLRGQLGISASTTELLKPEILKSVSLPQPYTVSFNTDGGSPVDSITAYEGDAILAPIDPVKLGYIFEGWYSNTLKTIPYQFTQMPGENKTIYAKWTLDTYDITYELNNGLNSIENPSTYTVTSNAIQLQSPTKEGHSFEGWYDNSLFNGNNITEIPMGSTGNIELYAKWTINQYTINFDTGGGTVISPITQDYGTSILVPSNPERQGYAFNGWDGVIPEIMPAMNMTIQAIWVALSYEIAYVLYGGTNHLDNPVVYQVESLDIILNHPSREGYSFDGWYNNSSFNGPVITDIPNGSFGHITLYAKWTINQYTINFNTTGGSLIDSITQDFGTTIIIPDAPSREGYVFNGFSSEIPATMPAENLEIEARWLKESTDLEDNIQVNVQGLKEAIDSSLTDGKNIEILFVLKAIGLSEVSSGDRQLLNSYLKNHQSTAVFDIKVVLKEQGQTDLIVNNLNQKVVITMEIPAINQGFKNYQMVRIHQGVLERIECIYDEDNQTLTFETDKFSTYAIVYDGGTNQWGWLLLFLLIPIGYVGYRYKHVILGFVKKKAEEKKDEITASTIETIVLEEVILEDIETRTKFHSEEEVKEGNYLEITELLESTNRIVEVKDGKLPKTLEELNQFIALKDEEFNKFNVHMNGTPNYLKRSPGSYAEQGYYVEVDIEGNIVNNYISLKRRLPPTTKKGHKWIKIEKRKIKSQ